MKIILSKTGFWRKDELRVRTDVIKEGNKIYVKKTALGSESKKILKNIKKTYKILSDSFPKELRLVQLLKQNEDFVTFEFCNGLMLEKEIESALVVRDFKKAKILYEKGLALIDLIKPYEPSDVEIKKITDFFKIDKLNLKNNLYIYPPITEVTADHIFVYNNNYWLIDYEVFFDFPIPKDFIKFRYQFYLVHNLQQIFQSIASKGFSLKTYLKGIFIPVEWDGIFKIPLNKIKMYLKMEEKLQAYMNWLEPRYSQFADYKAEIISTPVRDYLTKGKAMSVDSGTHQEVIMLRKDLDEYKVMMNRITSAKFFKLWQLYCNIRDNHIKKLFYKIKK